MSGAPFKYIKQAHTMHGKFSKNLSKKSFESNKKFWVNKLRNYGGMLQKASLFTQNFFWQALRKFSCIVWACLIYLKGAPDIVSDVPKRIRNIRHAKNIIRWKKWKSLDFTFKMTLGRYGGMLRRVPFFDSKLFLTSS